MVKIMDIPDPRGRGSFWEAYRACAEENRVRIEDLRETSRVTSSYVIKYIPQI